LRHIPGSVIYMTGFISAVFLVFCSIFYSSNKTAFIWTLFGGIAFGLLTGFLYWQNDLWQSQTNERPVAQYQKENEEKGDIQQHTESVLELSIHYPDIGAVIKGTKTFQELSPEVQKVYIKEKARLELAEMVMKGPRFTPEQITRILQQSSISDMKKTMEEAVTMSASAKISVESFLSEKQGIRSVMVEGRLTCDLKDGAEIPPSEVQFIPVGNANSYLEGTHSKSRLDFVSPVRFRRQDDNHIVVINRFSLPPGSDLDGRPIDSLKNFDILTIPVITVVYGDSFKRMKLFEVSMSVNGKDVWYYRYEINQPFQAGPSFKIPFESFKKA
jgi:hypothetical protein